MYAKKYHDDLEPVFLLFHQSYYKQLFRAILTLFTELKKIKIEELDHTQMKQVPH